MSSPPSSDKEPRERCTRCLRPAALCLCPLIPRIPNRTRLAILQHQREARHPMGTVRLAELAFEKVHVAIHRLDGERPPDLTALVTPDTALLYPSPDARELASLPEAERPGQLLILDGTWSQVRVLMRRYPALSALPQVRLSPTCPGQYRVRREPRPECLSTIEALIGALRILEPETPFLDALEQAFWALVGAQAECAQARRHRRRRTRPPAPPSREGAIPAVFTEAPERLIIAWGELSSRPDPGVPGGRVVEVLRWCARRLGTEERLDAILRPVDTSPSDAFIHHTGIAWQDLESGMTREAFLEAWRRFCKPDDLVAVWSAHTRDGFAAALASEAPGAHILLKTTYANARRLRPGSPRELLEREGRPFDPEPMAGRAGPMLGQLVAVARLLGSIKARQARA